MPDSRLIVQAFEAAIQPLGDRGARYVLADLPYHGVFLNDPELTLEKLVKGINSLFSLDAARMLLEQVIIELGSYVARRKSDRPESTDSRMH